MVNIPPHARKQLAKRGINEADAIENVEGGEIIIEEVNGRFGLKKYSKMRGLERDLIVVWFFNKKGEKEVVTAYWRGRRV